MNSRKQKIKKTKPISMKLQFILHILIPLSLINNSIFAQELQGTVKDIQTKELLPGATLYIPDLKTGAITDLNGHYQLKGLPKGKFVIQVKLLGYAAESKQVDLVLTSTLDFELRVSAIEKNEVVVTGSAFVTDNKRTSVPVSQIDKLQIALSSSDNLIKALAQTPGVSAVSTGNGISKPVIRGLSYNRVVVVNEGVRQEGQQWGDEHGIEVDQFSADKIEILKGPSSLLYGSDALGGVINILEPIPAPQGKIRGELDAQYSTNNRLSSNSLMFEGNQDGFIWRGRGTYKNSAAFRTPVETVYNSAFNEANGEVMIGLNKPWGYSHLHVSRWTSNIGLTEGDRDSLSGKFLDSNGQIATEAELNSRSLALPHQNLRHTKITTVNNLILGKNQLRINLGVQQNDRQEFENSETDPGLWFRLKTLTYDAKFYFPEAKGIETAIGVSGMVQENQNKGSEYLIPAYKLYDGGFFATLKKSTKRTTLNIGFRYDSRHIDGAELLVDNTQLFSPFHLNFSALSGSAGCTFHLNDVYNLKANIGRGFRSPNISELSANGVHEGTFRYEVGNLQLHPETSLQFDAGLSADYKMMSLSLDLFYNQINNFIYYRNSNLEETNLNGNTYPVYHYVQGQSTLKGGEFSLDIHPFSRLHFESSIAYVEGNNDDLDKPLPFIPPMRIVSELKYELKLKKSSKLKEAFVKLEIEHSSSQDRIDIFETSTKAYALLNTGVGVVFRTGQQEITVFVNANNLANKKYFDHLSRLKEIDVSGMGRNIGFGIRLPFGLR